MIAMMVPLVLAAQSQTREIVTRPSAPPVTVSIASTRLECDLREDDGATVRFTLRRGGGRAESYEGALMGTTLSVTVVNDPGEVLSGYALDAWGLKSIFGQARSQGAQLGFGERFQMLLDRVGEEGELNRSNRVAMRIEEHRAPEWGMKPYVRAVGFCDVASGTSASLTRMDAKESNR